MNEPSTPITVPPRGRLHRAATAVAIATAVAGCALPLAGGEDASFLERITGSFRAQGIAGVDRLQQDPTQAACSTGKDLTPAQARAIEQRELATIRPPAGGYFGDFKEGEKLAQNGRGMTWTDKDAKPSSNGGNCYNCHQIDRKEISFGTIGPSLAQYGTLRGVRDLADPAAQDVIRYTWGKIYNAQAYAACSNMPRFGHKGLLDEKQMRDLMSLLLDPKSPVNQ